MLGTGHPLADILLLKYAPLAAEAQEGVAFFGRAGQAAQERQLLMILTGPIA